MLPVPVSRFSAACAGGFFCAAFRAPYQLRADKSIRTFAPVAARMPIVRIRGSSRGRSLDEGAARSCRITFVHALS